MSSAASGTEQRSALHPLYLLLAGVVAVAGVGALIAWRMSAEERMSAAERNRATAGPVAEPPAQPVATEPKPEPQKVVDPRTKQFIGRWCVLSPNGTASSYFNLTETEAMRDHVPKAPGKWEVVGDEVHITYQDDWLCVVRPQQGGYRITSYAPGAKWGQLPATPTGEWKGEQIGPMAQKAPRK
jgi:hypothetical protein